MWKSQCHKQVLGFTHFHKRSLRITYVHIPCASFTSGVESVIRGCIVGLSMERQYIRMKTFFFSIILVAVEMNLKANIYKRRWNVKVPLSFSRAQFDRALSNMFDVQIYTQRHVQKFAKYDLELSFLETYHRLLHIHTERKNGMPLPMLSSLRQISLVSQTNSQLPRETSVRWVSSVCEEAESLSSHRHLMLLFFPRACHYMSLN